MKKFDAAIAGGGVIGGAIALELARAGLRVAGFDRQRPGHGASGNECNAAAGKSETSALPAIYRRSRGDFRKERGFPAERNARGAVLARYQGGTQHYYRTAPRAGTEGGAASRRRRTRAGAGAERRSGSGGAPARRSVG